MRSLVLLVVALAIAGCGKESTAPGGSLVFAEVSAGDYHTCAVTTGGAAYCWGHNDVGQLGIGTFDSLPHPVPEPVAGGRRFVSITTGRGHSCGLTTSGGTYCWGLNDFGELGTTAATESCTGPLPCIPVPALVSGGLRFVAVSAGATFTCAATAAGVAYCWGLDDEGELGNGTISVTGQFSPVAVAGAWTLAAIGSGDSHACAVTAAGAAVCWGANERGQLGTGNLVSETVPTPVTGGLTFATVSGGTYHSCGVTPAGAAWCWGHNHYGRLGDGSYVNQDQTSPQAVVGGLTFAAVSTGGTHTCGVTTGAAAYCWGADRYGQLGDGVADTLVHPAPEAVLGGLALTSVSAGVVHSCGLTAAGVAYCWGDNTYGALGDSTTLGRIAPVRVARQP